ncbi:MAG TPA: hypothetical protein VJQ45_05540 [Ktedonobacterales bacterium]|nr:hypothetical protein [Ktedonobacterales bacterium]
MLAAAHNVPIATQRAAEHHECHDGDDAITQEQDEAEFGRRRALDQTEENKREEQECAGQQRKTGQFCHLLPGIDVFERLIRWQADTVTTQVSRLKSEQVPARSVDDPAGSTLNSRPAHYG